MRFVYQPHLIENSLWGMETLQILSRTEAEFIPPLHARNSTTQKDLSKVVFSDDEKAANVQAYFQSMLSQQFILALEEEHVVGFLSFRKNDGVYYVSTIAVEPQRRNRGIARGLYEELFQSIGLGETYTTRTWESNQFHGRLLDSLGFKVYMEKDEGRTDSDGRRLLSLYYIKTSES